jgi:hypothetical protein
MKSAMWASLAGSKACSSEGSAGAVVVGALVAGGAVVEVVVGDDVEVDAGAVVAGAVDDGLSVVLDVGSMPAAVRSRPSSPA